MRVKLRILHGKLQSKQGGSAGQEVDIRGPKFVIGSAEDCSMRCPSSAVSPHHCEIHVNPLEAVIRDLDSKTGVLVNDQRVEHEHALQAGDHLRIGRLEFEVLIEETAATSASPPEESSEESSEENDPVSEDLSTSLIEADEKERVHRLEDPESRQFHLEEALAEVAKHRQETPEEEPPEDTKKKRGKKKLGKFTPPPPPPQPENTEEAAQDALRRLFEP
jgi:pSer/pThr/pTyr-binding forkhead associated (FHA) protein